ncbi:ATP-binding protein [Rhizobium sullae]|uniref:ATP-binding protein n=1 Tax=Rhizobium sullae TaxID=50338 RepID=UPI000B351C09|nr:adenylate/guanylate cyclase domain-containing protein [Rhizobium sullae]
MSDVEKWLADAGLAHLAPAFARAQVDFDSLRLLTDKDLREMRIPVGPRRKLLAAVAAMGRPPEARALRNQPERRRLTILFCDMVGSTGYAARLDPEDFSDFTQRYLNRCGGLARSHGGFVANYIGDAFQVLFGYPIAEEDDAERALELAFDLLLAVPQIEAPDHSRPRVRIGIASGLVVVGDIEGAPAGVSTVAFGPVPNLAQRLEAIADPQTILLDQSTYASACRAFEFQDLGARTLKGFADPVRIWRANKALSRGRRFSKTRLTRLVGRTSEIERVLALWRKVADEDCGRWLLLSGEPGIGKSRILFEVVQRVPAAKTLIAQCSPAYSHSTLFPFLQLLRQEAGISASEPSSIATRKLEAVLSLSNAPLSDSFPIFARLLTVEQVDYPPSERTSTEQQAIVRRVFVEWLRHVAKSGPLLLAIEDEQWIDPSSSSLLNMLLQDVRDFPALVVITSREDAWKIPDRLPNIEHMKVGRLTRDEANALIENVAIGVKLTSEVTRSLLRKSEGVPLYVEELAKSAVELTASSDGRSRRAKDGPIEVPNTLQSALLSRLDKLGEGKVIAQIAAVIGREFDIRMLARIADVSLDNLKPQLQRLTEVGLVSPQPFSEWPRYTFTHALLQEAACGALLRDRRRQLHALVVDAMEKTEPHIGNEHPEVLAQHLDEAGEFERAADHWLAAGIKVGSTWAKVESANMFAKGLECVRKLSPSSHRDRKELRLELERGDVLYAAYGYMTDEGSTAYRNVMRLSEALGDAEAAIRALDGLFGIAFNSARFTDAEWASNQLLDMGQKQASTRALVLGMQFLGMCSFSQGRFKEARSYLEEALAYRQAADEVGSDFPSMAMIYLSWTLQLLGEEQSALAMFLEAEEQARQQTDYRLAACLGNGCILMALRHDATMLERMIDELMPLARKNGFQLWLNMASFFHGWMLVVTRQDASGLDQMRHICDNMGEQEIDKTCYLGILAESYLRLGRIPDASATVEQALALAEKTGEHYFTAELLRLQGELNAQTSEEGWGAQAALRRSIAFARRQGSKTWELRAKQTLEAFEASKVRPAMRAIRDGTQT